MVTIIAMLLEAYTVFKASDLYWGTIILDLSYLTVMFVNIV